MAAYASSNETPSAEQEHDRSVQREGDDSEIFETGQKVSERLQHFGEVVTDFVQERPLAAVGIAAAAGFFVARLIKR